MASVPYHFNIEGHPGHKFIQIYFDYLLRDSVDVNDGLCYPSIA